MTQVREYGQHKREYEKRAPLSLLKDTYDFTDYTEAYTPFFVWVSQNYEVLYLDGERHRDGVSTILKDHQGRPFLLHAWYSRMHNRDRAHTERINRLYRQALGRRAGIDLEVKTVWLRLRCHLLERIREMLPALPLVEARHSTRGKNLLRR